MEWRANKTGGSQAQHLHAIWQWDPFVPRERTCKAGDPGPPPPPHHQAQDSGGCVDAVSAAIQVLEDDPITNAGRGSNLTEAGHIECDANIIDGFSGTFGAVGVVPDQVCRMLSKLPLAC